MCSSDLVDYTRWYPGSYKDLIKANKLKPYPMIAEGVRAKRPVSLPDSDLDFIEDHFGSVWTEPSALPFKTDIPFAEARRPVIAIKSAGKGGSKTGKHYKDVLIDAPFAKEVRRGEYGKTTDTRVGYCWLSFGLIFWSNHVPPKNANEKIK